MHPDAYQWVAAHVPDKRTKVLEVGSRDVNGTPRPLFTGSDYTGIDIAEGPGVDLVVDVRDHKGKYDVVVCCEVLEHAPDPDGIIDAAHGLLKKGGTLILTAAGMTRKPHSAVDGAELRPDEHYDNIHPQALTDMLNQFASAEVDEYGHDIRAVAVK